MVHSLARENDGGGTLREGKTKARVYGLPVHQDSKRIQRIKEADFGTQQNADPPTYGLMRRREERQLYAIIMRKIRLQLS